ncbi:MAG: methyltransferase [Rhodococcus sp.]|nr:methyltransferase [Rhodococcus sp. (in: high G+C Gram-positive bacteria)]
MIDHLHRRLTAAGIELWRDSGRLHYRAPHGALTDEFRAAILANRDALLADLSRESFPLTEIQAGYLVGRTAAYADGGVGCQGYHQFDLDLTAAGVSAADRASAVRAAWGQVVDAHPMLRMRIDPDRFEQWVDATLDVPLEVTEYPDQAAADQAGAQLGDRLVWHVYDPSEDRPLLDAAVVLGENTAVLHLSVDLLVTDYVGIRTILDDFDRALGGGAVRRPAATFREYLQADRRHRATCEYRALRRSAEEYWSRRILEMPAPLRFPPAPTQDAVPDRHISPSYSRRSQRLSSGEWERLCANAAELEATPVALILAELGAVAAAHSPNAAATVMMTRVDRRPIVADVERIVGDFTSTLVVSLPSGNDRDAAVRAVRDDVFAGLEYAAFSGMEVARRLADDARTETVMPVVVTYTVDAAGSRAPRYLTPRAGTGRSRTPQVLLDIQITPLPDGVAIDWDSRDDGFDPDVLDAAFIDFVARLRRAAETGEPDVETALAAAHARLAPTGRAVAELAADSEQTVRQIVAWHLARAGMDRPLPVEEVARRLGAARHTPLVRRWIDELTATGMVAHGDHGIYLTAPPVPLDESFEQWRHIRRRAADIDYGDRQLAYVEDCLRSLEGLLNGSVDPLALLFPDGEFDVARAAYDDNLVARYLNGLCAAGIRAAAESARSPLRILEVGGGVGGTTRTVLAELAGYHVDYLFTDVSRFFLDAAARQWPQIRTAMFDVNDDAGPPGETGEGFDVILCANVLHNARDIPAALDRLRRLLRPGGALAIIDSTAPSAALMATMEFKDGLEDSRDVRAESGSPFLLLPQWREVLAGDAVIAYPPTGHALETAGQHLFWVAGNTSPSPDALRQVAQIWSEVLDVPVDQLRPDSDFVELGGDSLLLARCVGRLRRELDWAEPSAWDRVYRRIVADPTVAGCVAALTGRFAGETPNADRPDTEPARLNAPQWVAVAEPTPAAAPADVRLIELVAPTVSSATPIVLVHDGSGGLGPYRELIGELAAHVDGGVYGIERSPGDGYLDIPVEQLFTVLQRSYARSLLNLGPSSFHLVGFCMGGLIAAGTATLLESHGVTAAVTVISSYRIPFRLADEVLTDYAFAKALGWHPADFGIVVDDDQVGQTLTAIRAAGHRTIDATVVADHAPEGLTDALRAAPPTVADRVRSALGTDGRDGITDDVLLGMRETFVHSVAAVAAWRQPVMLTPATFLRQEKPMSYLPSLGEDMSAFWRSHCVGGLGVIDVAGDHFTCLTGENAQNVAQLLAELTPLGCEREVR